MLRSKHIIHYIYQPDTLRRVTVAVYCENLTKGIRTSTVWEKCSSFKKKFKSAVTYSMAVSQQVSCNVLRQYSLSFILSLVSYNYLHFLPFYAHPNRLYNSCQAFHLKFLIAFRQWNKSSYSSLATDVIRFLQRHDCFVPIPNSLQWTTAAKLQKHIKITT